MRELSMQMPKEITPEKVIEYVDAYTGDLKIKDPTKMDKFNFVNLKKKAKMDMDNSQQNLNINPSAVKMKVEETESIQVNEKEVK